MQKVSDSTLELIVEIAALRYACTKALALLQDGDAEAKDGVFCLLEAKDADRVEKLLETVLRGIK
jgi:hypothetical protein